MNGSERVEISLTLTNVGTEPIENFVYALFFDPHQIYDFSPADVEAHRALMFRGYPRQNHLIGWMDATPRLSVTDYRYGWDGGMILPDPLGVDLEPGKSESRNYLLVTGSEQRAVLENLYREIGVATQTATFGFETSSNDYLEIVVRDDLPFGGTGQSGLGNYRGRDGFRTFSHARGVYREGFVDMAKLAGTLPPYGQKIAKMLESQIKK